MHMRNLFSLPRKTSAEIEKDVEVWLFPLFENVPPDEIRPAYDRALKEHTGQFPLPGMSVYQCWLKLKAGVPTVVANRCGVCWVENGHNPACPMDRKLHREDSNSIAREIGKRMTPEDWSDIRGLAMRSCGCERSGVCYCHNLSQQERCDLLKCVFCHNYQYALLEREKREDRLQHALKIDGHETAEHKCLRKSEHPHHCPHCDYIDGSHSSTCADKNSVAVPLTVSDDPKQGNG
jgi:hypothetical protein